jgi:hypothetical protein
MGTHKLSAGDAEKGFVSECFQIRFGNTGKQVWPALASNC